MSKKACQWAGCHRNDATSFALGHGVAYFCEFHKHYAEDAYREGFKDADVARELTRVSQLNSEQRPKATMEQQRDAWRAVALMGASGEMADVIDARFRKALEVRYEHAT